MIAHSGYLSPWPNLCLLPLYHDPTEWHESHDVIGCIHGDEYYRLIVHQTCSHKVCRQLEIRYITINTVFILVATPLVIASTKQIQAINNVAFVGLLYAIGFGMIYWIAGFHWFVVSTLIWTTGDILSVTNHEVDIASHSPRSHRGRINAVLPLVISMSWSLNPLVMGYFITRWDFKSVWPLAMTLSIIGAPLLVGLGRFEQLFLHKLPTEGAQKADAVRTL